MPRLHSSGWNMSLLLEAVSSRMACGRNKAVRPSNKRGLLILRWIKIWLKDIKRIYYCNKNAKRLQSITIQPSVPGSGESSWQLGYQAPEALRSASDHCEPPAPLASGAHFRSADCLSRGSKAWGVAGRKNIIRATALVDWLWNMIENLEHEWTSRVSKHLQATSPNELWHRWGRWIRLCHWGISPPSPHLLSLPQRLGQVRLTMKFDEICLLFCVVLCCFLLFCGYWSR